MQVRHHLRNFSRLSLWSERRSMLDEPYIVIESDYYKKENSNYVFIIDDVKEGQYEYIVDDGESLDSNEKGLVVKKNGEVVLSQKREL